MKFSFFFFSGRLIILPILGDPGAGLSEWDDFSFRPAPGSPGMITIRTLPRDTAQLLGYCTVHFVVQRPPQLCLTRRYFTFIERLKQLHCTWYSTW